MYPTRKKKRTPKIQPGIQKKESWKKAEKRLRGWVSQGLQNDRQLMLHALCHLTDCSHVLRYITICSPCPLITDQGDRGPRDPGSQVTAAFSPEKEGKRRRRSSSLSPRLRLLSAIFRLREVAYARRGVNPLRAPVHG